MNYDDYIACFSAGDDRRLVEEFFCEDVEFKSSGRDFQGKAALKEFLDWAHDGVREVPRRASAGAAATRSRAQAGRAGPAHGRGRRPRARRRARSRGSQ